MFTTSEFERIRSDFIPIMKERQSKLRRIWGTLLLITIIIIILLIVLLPKQFQNSETAWILPTYGGMAFLVFFGGFIISMNYTSEKPYMEALFPMIIEKINFDEGLQLEYEAYPPKEKEFNQKGGLFTKYASVKIRRKLKGYTEDQNPYTNYDCTMTTSNGKNQVTHFDGVYIVLHKQINTSLQVRPNGSPKNKNIHYEKCKDIEHIKVYKPEGDYLSNLDHTIIDYVKKLNEKPNMKRAYISIIDNEIHLALWYKKHPLRKKSPVIIETANHYLHFFKKEIEIANNLDTIQPYMD